MFSGVSLRVLLAPALLFAAAFSGQAAHSADFIPGGDETLDCKLTLQGTITSGDADRFVEAIRTHVLAEPWQSTFEGSAPRRICLDSPGGSLAEAIRMADVLLGRRSEEADSPEYFHIRSIGTVVPADATCHSGCAVLFMAGGRETETEVGRVPNRILHARGSLGFHAPGIRVGDGQYSKESVDAAFRVAVLSMRSLSDRQAEMTFPPSLMARMIGTPHDEMYVLTRLGEAAQWMIDIAGLPMVETPGKGNFMNACFATEPGLVPSIRYTQNWIKGHDRREDGERFEQQQSEHARVGGHRWSEELNKLRLSVLEDASSRMDDGTTLANFTFRSEREDEDYGLKCKAWYFGDATLRPFEKTGRRLHVSFERGSEMSVGPAFFFPPEAEFAALAARFDGQEVLASDTVVQEELRRADTRCYVFDGAGRKIDDEPCSAVETRRERADGALDYTTVFTWPAGSRTVLGSGLDGHRLNGAEFRPTHPYPQGMDSEDQRCLTSEATGNTFCYDKAVLR